MLKMIATLRRKPGLSVDAFRKHWRYVHGPLVLSLPEMTRHIRRYVQNLPADLPMPADATGGEPIDGVAEMVFDDFESMQRCFAEPSYLARVRPDEEAFLDLGRCQVVVVEERVLIGT
ncbi:MAG TPA: EthD domain-containing protein [Myxococcota bacterium]|jgi:uncharacterized protein (TIGR02118 family)|nr:EthD domain-containing protein [Myxococcota bacterium]